MNFKEINNIIQGSTGILANEFALNNIKKAKEKDKYACISCNSSDGLHLYENTNTCHCYSCGQTWNVVNFTMETQGIDYISALKYINNTYNLNLPIKTSKQVKTAQTRLEKALKEYKKELITEEDKKFKEIEDDIYTKIRETNLDININEEEKENIIKEYDNYIYQKSIELAHKKDFINDLSIEFMTAKEIAYMLKIELINPKQKDFISEKIELLNLAQEIDEENRKKLSENFYNLKYSEYINYAKYKPNVVVNVNKYIVENNKLETLLKYKYSLLIAPTGSGKTYTILKMFKNMEELLKKQNKKICFVVPNAMQVQQIQEEYGIKGAWNNADQDIIFSQNTISCYTWDKFGKIQEDLSNTIVILDETHQIFQDMYRKNKIDRMLLNISKCSNRIDITATPNKIGFNTYNYILEYKQKIQTKYNINLYKNIDDDKIINIINNASGKVALFRDKIAYLEAITNQVDKNYDIIHAQNKDTNITFNNIIKNGNIGDKELICNTSVMVAGLNIKEKDMTDIIVVDVKDIATIKQYIARFRDLESVNVHIFNNYKEISNLWHLENKIKYEIKKAQEACNGFNKDRLEGFETTLIEDNTLFKSLDKDMYIYKQNGIYKVDEISIRHKTYTRYYNGADIVSFKNLLEEYFSNVTIIRNEKVENEEVKENIKDSKKTSKEYLKELEKHSTHIVDFYNIKKNNINTNTKNYLKTNNLTTEKILEYVENNNLEHMLEDNKVKKKLNSFTKLVTELNYPPNMAYKLSNMNGRTSKIFKEKINVLLYEEIYRNYKKYMDLTTPNIILYNFILNEFPLTIGYDDEIIKEKLEILKNTHKIDLKDIEFREYLNYVYIIESKKTRKEIKSEAPTTYINNNNSNSSVPQDEKKSRDKKLIRVYCPVDYHSLDSICKEYILNDIDKKWLKVQMDKKIDLIKIKKDKMKEAINIFN